MSDPSRTRQVVRSVGERPREWMLYYGRLPSDRSTP